MLKPATLAPSQAGTFSTAIRPLKTGYLERGLRTVWYANDND